MAGFLLSGLGTLFPPGSPALLLLVVFGRGSGPTRWGGGNRDQLFLLVGEGEGLAALGAFDALPSRHGVGNSQDGIASGTGRFHDTSRGLGLEGLEESTHQLL
jgi:hypothetical protein